MAGIGSYPPLRSTLDIDVFLAPEVIASAGQTKAVRDALDEPGYKPRPEAQYYQFIRDVEVVEENSQIKVDLLAPVPDKRAGIKIKGPRIRPRAYSGLHARVAREAFSVAENATAVEIACGESSVTINVPHPMSYVIMKLHAFRDRLGSDDLDLPRYHAFDLYVAVAMLNEEETEQARRMKSDYEAVPEFAEARRIRREHFANRTDLGPVRLMEHVAVSGLERDLIDLGGFLSDLAELVG